MTINMTLTNPGTRLSCAAEVAVAQRPGTGVFASAHEIRGTRRVTRRWADLPTIKQFRVPLSIRERSS